MLTRSLIFGGLAVLVLTAGVVVAFVQRSSGDGGDAVRVILPTATPEPVVELKVYISGAVENPGVYIMKEGDRLADVMEMSGGASEDADLTAINLAVRVKDEDHWHIPRVGEEPRAAASSKRSNAGGSGKIDLNSANVEQLKTLPGIGDVKAQSIVSYREANGPFASVEDLIDVRGIGPATLEAIRDLVEVR